MKHNLLKSVIISVILLMGVSNAWAGASWIGKSFIVANGTWYNASGTGQTAGAFHNKNLGSITSLTLGGEIQTYGQTDGAKNPAKMHYQISGKNAAYITLYWFKYQDNNNFFHSNSNGSTSSNNTFASKTIDISSLTPGNYTLSVWFEQPDGGQWDSNNNNNYKATFTIDPVVTFKANGGTGNDYTQTVKYNTSTTLTANKFTRTGYSFNGWKTAANSGTSYANQASVKFTANTALYAQWTPAKYTINYKDQNNANFSGSHATGYPTQHTYGTATTLSTASKTGYTFGGWHTDQGCTNKVTSLGATAYTANITLYAKWTENTYTVTINNDGHGTTTPSGAQSNVGQVTGVGISATANNGYQFKNWTITSGSGSFTSTTATTTTFKPTATSTIQANFSIINYNITYENLNGVTHTNPATYNIETPTITFTNPTSERTGYTFNGWSLASIAQGSTGNVTVTAQWTANTYIVAFNANGGSGTMSDQNFTYGTSQNLTANAFTRTGYTFAGWNTKADGTGTSYTDKQSVSNLSSTNGATVTLYAQWTINQYTINYGVVGRANGTIQLNSGDNVTTSASATANYNTRHTFTAEPANDYKIEGWYSDANGANKIDAAGTKDTYEIASLTDDIDVYVKFVEAAEVMSKVTVTATAGGTVSPSGTVEVGNKTSTTFTATPASGYRFDHWTYSVGVVKKTENNTNEQGSITITADSDGTLTANFVRVYTVNFFATPAAASTATATVGGNAITSGDKIDANASIIFNAAVANAYTGQCTFQRWVDGAGTVLSTSNPYTHTPLNGDITVKAIFKITQYTLTFSAGDGGFVSAKANNSNIASPANLDYNTSVTLTAEPNAGCAFVKWVNENEELVASTPTYTINKMDGNKTVQAIFAQGTTVYLKPVDWWKSDNARFAVYMWKDGGNEWREMEDLGCNGDIYTIDIPHGYTKLIFARLKPVTDAEYDKNDEWKNVWNQTEDLTVPAGNKNTYDMNAQSITNLYLKPHDNWKKENARFAAYFFVNANNKWVDMKHVKDGIYKCTIPTDKAYKTVIYGRMNPGTNTNNFNEGTKWNQTGNLTIPTNGTNCYTLTGGEWDGVTGEWSTIYDDSKWTTYSAPSYKIKINTATNGTIKVTKADGTAVTNNSSLALGTEIKIVFTPNVDYNLSNYFIEYATATDEADEYIVCGPTEITAEFDKKTPSRTVYLRPNEDWLRDNPVMAARVRKSSGGNDKWYVMHTTSEDYTGAYSCNIPNDYDQIIFVRLNPKGSDAANDGFNWTNAWNQTKELTIIDKDNDKTNDHKLRFAIGDKIVGGNDNDRYDGKWEENTPIWGLTANFNDWTAEKAIFMGYPGKLNTVPPFTPQHAFKLFNFFYAENSNYFGNAGTMKRENSEQWWTMDVNEQTNCQMKLDAKGDYIYQLRFLTVGPELRKQISVTYPAEEMYYLNYVEGNRWSYAISNTSDNTKSDKVSFFVSQGTATIKLTDANKAEKATKTFNIPEAGVYNFTLQHGPIPTISTELEKYTGNYYVRTDAAAGGWNAYKQEGNRMTYSSYSDKNQNFDHYFCKWIDSPEPEKGNNQTNVKFCVANDYSHALSDELNGDEIIEKTGVATGCLPDSANVRFAWDSKTNELSRAYISGSAYARDRFLVLTGNEYLKAIGGGSLNISGLNKNEAIFGDKGNWVYQLDVQANRQTEIKLTAQYNDKVQTFFGDARAAADNVSVLAATNEDYHNVRMIYNFKTNNLVAAWLLNDVQQAGGSELNSDMLVIRKHHDQAQQIQLSSTLRSVGTAYGVMTFEKDFVNDTKKSIYERALYWVSFPFDVCIRDVFGFGEYMDTWIMEYYDGEARAKNGAWVDSESYWTYMTNVNDTLKAGVGYVLCLDLDKMGADSEVFKNTSEVSLYFPSATPIGDIDKNQAVPITVPGHQCDIHRPTQQGDRRIADSHWNVIGVPRFINLNITLDGGTIDQQDVVYYYQYNASDNSYAPLSSGSQTFQTMQAYMVQYAGTINWWEVATPQQLAARRNANATPEKVNLRLEIAQDDVTADKTFIQLQEEGATADFDMNKDLTKIINAGANIYTLVGEGNIQTAGNVLPMDECEVPVGVKVDAAGEYTIRMPEGTEGMVVELIDYYTNTRTNLLFVDYTVDLSAGTCNDRFALHIQPSKSGVTTNIDQINGGSMHHEGVQKYIIDGKLIIRTAEGEVFDAQGHRL